jgi:hypothetical protein
MLRFSFCDAERLQHWFCRVRVLCSADAGVSLDRLQVLLQSKELEESPPVVAGQSNAIKIENADFSWGKVRT